MGDKKSIWNFDMLFRPRSVAVIGASKKELTIGYRIIRNLVEMRFCGRIYPVNSRASILQDLLVYQSILDIPCDVDLAHIVVKSGHVPKVLSECAEKGVKVCIINTAGFKETGPEGAKLEEEIVKIAHKTGIRILGPNCQGIINTDPEVNAYCNFTFTRQKPGCISIFTQSGGVGEVINNRLCELGEGLRIYASSGNSCDIQCHEILKYWGDDPGTRVIICHIENIEDPEVFKKVAGKVSKKKPVLGMLSGRTRAGERAIASHTGSIIKNSIHNKTVVEDSGILLFNSLEEICQTARAFAHLPLPEGKNAGIITNTGGSGIIAADELIERGCRVPKLAEQTQKALRKGLYTEAIVSNPVDILATAGPEHIEKTLSVLINDPEIDSILLNFITPFFVDCEAVALKIRDISLSSDKPVICVVMTDKNLWEPTLRVFSQAGIPTYDLPEIGAKVLASMTQYRGFVEK